MCAPGGCASAFRHPPLPQRTCDPSVLTCGGGPRGRCTAVPPVSGVTSAPPPEPARGTHAPRRAPPRKHRCATGRTTVPRAPPRGPPGGHGRPRPGRRPASHGAWLRVDEVGPGPRGDHWTYLTAGCRSRANHDGHGVEFVLTAPVPDPLFADLIALTAFYHCGPRPHPLGVGHSLPVGEPWVPGSACDHILVSLPYLHGSDLEVCHLPGGRARLLWLLPVTTSEIVYRREHGTEALEQRFDDAGIRPPDLHRPPVV
ncbi:suppressor of fused domain protein [Streptomyces sp. NPDC058864]